MSDRTIRLVIDLTYDTDVMHGDDEDSIEWFNSILHGDDLQLGDFGDLGDMIGPVKVVAELTGGNDECKDRQPTSAKDIGNITLDTDENGIWLINETPEGPQQMSLVSWEVIAKYVRQKNRRIEYLESISGWMDDYEYNPD